MAQQYYHGVPPVTVQKRKVLNSYEDFMAEELQSEGLKSGSYSQKDYNQEDYSQKRQGTIGSRRRENEPGREKYFRKRFAGECD